VSESGDRFLYKKEVDWSVLHDGFSIPAEFQGAVQSHTGGLSRGDTKRITMSLQGERFPVNLKNQAFDEKKHLGHVDVLQVRYSQGSTFATILRRVFAKSDGVLNAFRSEVKKSGSSKHVRVPEGAREYLVLYAGTPENEIVCDCVTSEDIAVVKSFFDKGGMREEEFEGRADFELKDSRARMETREQVVRIRRLDRSIGESLKRLYDYRCQVCAENFGKDRGTDTAESHHIADFISSLNNDSDNIIIVCPNHHTAIHKAHPVFDRERLRFAYPNGFEEKLKLDRHLRGVG
jgi:5-methylcytosine-specific restriction enzyme A